MWYIKEFAMIPRGREKNNKKEENEEIEVSKVDRLRQVSERWGKTLSLLVRRQEYLFKTTMTMVPVQICHMAAIWLPPSSLPSIFSKSATFVNAPWAHSLCEKIKESFFSDLVRCYKEAEHGGRHPSAPCTLSISKKVTKIQGILWISIYHGIWH